MTAARVSSLTVATDSGMSSRFSLRLVAVTMISAMPSSASAAGVSVSPVAWAAAGDAAQVKVPAMASASSDVRVEMRM